MAHKTSWYIDKRVMLIEYFGDIDKAELQEINAELDRFLAEGESPIHIISDNSKMGKVEISISIVRETFSAAKKPGWGWMFLIGVDVIVRFFAEIFSAQFGVKIRNAKDVAEAFEALKKLDLSLNDELKAS